MLEAYASLSYDCSATTCSIRLQGNDPDNGVYTRLDVIDAKHTTVQTW